jgi:putative ABC transport system permease protein
MGTFWQDLRYGIRVLLKSPGFTAVAVITLALGIGANTAIFSVVDAVLLRPLPVPHSEQLVDVYNQLKQKILFITDVPPSYPEYQDIERQNTTFSGLIAYRPDLVALEGQSESQLVPGMLVTGNYFDVLGVKMVLGRTFSAAEVSRPSEADVAVISYSFWQQHFGGDPGILGKTINLNGQLFAITGVAPPNFNGLVIVPTPQIWVPLTEELSQKYSHSSLQDRKGASVWVVGRLKPGATMAQAQTEMSTIADRLAGQYPKSDKDHTIALFPANRVRLLPDLDRTLYGASLVLMAVVGLVLMIACANVAAMSLARATGRRKEVAVRMAVGAGRWRLMRQLLTESLLLALVGGAAAVGMTVLVNREILHALTALPLVSELNLTLGLRIDYRVLVFTLAVVVLTTALFGMAPAIEAARTSPSEALKEEGRSGGTSKRRLLNALVVAQVGFSLVLLVCAGLSLRSVLNAYRVQPGFDPHGVVTAQFAPGLVGYNPAQSAAFYDKLIEQVKTLPGVTDAGYANILPLTFSIDITGIVQSEKAASMPEKQWPQIDTSEVGPGYFRALRIPLLRGRAFTEQDTATAPQVAIANEALAARFWPGEDPLGKHVRTGKDAVKDDYEIVGVVATGKYRTLGENPRPFLYRCILQGKNPSRTLVVRSSAPSAGLLASIRQIGRQLDPKVPVLGLETMSRATGPALLLPKLGADFFGLAGLLGLVLACVGIYGVISYSVNQRTHEIGVRVALGAQRRDVARLVLGRSLGLTLAGVGIGLGGAFAVTRVLSDILYGISATDPVTFVAVPLLLILVALAACYVPVRRAMRVDPMVALRYE